MKPKLLLHACCGPCATVAIERLKNEYDLFVFFYNPNIVSSFEHDMRLYSLHSVCKNYDAVYGYAPYDPGAFELYIRGHKKQPEGGSRCARCFELRLRLSAKLAQNQGCEYFATTLTTSPHKNADLINQIGSKIKRKNLRYLPTDFKQNGGYARSVELSKQMGIYRQNYCGCMFSK